MTDSLLLAGLELLGTVTNPEYRLGQGGLGLGDPEPDTATIASLLLDGDQVTGDRSKNRQISLTVRVTSPTVGTRTDLTAKMDALRQAANSKSFTLQWTPTGGLPVVFDCYRASVTRSRSILIDNQLGASLTLTFQAAPFGRSPAQQTVSGSTQHQIDSFDSAPTGATLDTSNKFEGTGSAQFTLTASGTVYNSGTPVSRTFAAQDISAYSFLSIRAATSVFMLLTTYTVTLSSSGGKSTTWTKAISTYSSFPLLTISIASDVTGTTGGGVDLTAVTGFSITASATNYNTASGTVTAHVDDLRALGGAPALITTTAGEVLLMPAITGSARTPVSLGASGSGMAAVLLHAPPVDQDTNAAILMGASGTQTIAAANSRYRGTYSLLLGAAATLSGTNTVTVTIVQKENGATVATKVLTTTYTAPVATGTLVPVGDVTLPLRATATDNTGTSYTFAAVVTSGTDTFSDILLCDVRGQTVIAVPPTSVPQIYVDAPDVSQGLGPVMASASAGDRANAYGIFDGVTCVGGPPLFEPGTNKVMAWALGAAPTVTATYYPRWLDERVS